MERSYTSDPNMANPEHLAVVWSGVYYLNKWVLGNLGISLDMSGANLTGAFLSEANLQQANLERGVPQPSQPN
jgi:uncharacterized protein YjbI with pentapeptide repeats